MTDERKTIRQEIRSEAKVQGSRFIATVSPTITKEEAEQFIARLRGRHHDASHNCYAYRIGTDRTEYRFNDDGEPAGSAGRSILAAIDKFELTDVTVVVTRYFGGTKLGVGGLVRAYRDSAEKALDMAEKITKYEIEQVHASFPHSHIGDVMHAVSKTGASIVDTSYDEEVHLRLEIRKSRLEELKSFLMEQTHGNIRIK